MSEPAKRRPYRSARRAEQARETRRRVLDAAERLLVESGYTGTTIDAIARAAGVAPQTVYGSFGSKRAVLGALVRRAVRGDEESSLPPEQEEAQAIRVSHDQREQLRLFALDISARLRRVAPLVEVLAAAAPNDPELAELAVTIQRQRLENLRSFTGWLGANGPLEGGLEQAAETVWALASPQLYQLCATHRGWSERRFADWLETTLATLLLRPAPGGR